MTQPKFAPITEDAVVRPAYRLDPPNPWTAHRPGELVRGSDRTRAGLMGVGIPGPDQGYALHLAKRFASHLVLNEGEHDSDVLSGAVAIGMRRAACFGRAPVAGDIELALELFGFLENASEEVLEARRTLFAGVGHDYWAQRQLAARIPETTLRLSLVELSKVLAGPGELFASLAGLVATNGI